MRVEARIGAGVAALLLLAPLARAGGDREVQVGDDLHVRARWTWPDMLEHGAQPLFFEARNLGSEAHRLDLRLELHAMGEHLIVHRALELAAGERVSFELPVPVTSGGSNAWHATLTGAGASANLPGLGASQVAEPGVKNVLVVAASPVEPGLPGRLASELSVEAAGTWRKPEPRADPRRTEVLRMRGMLTSAGSGPPAQIVQVTGATFLDLARQPASYSSLDAVVVDARAGFPDKDRLAALCAFARTGGVLAIRGRAIPEVAAAIPELAPWLEPRFRLHGTDDWPAFACGQGLLFVDESGGVLDSRRRAAFVELLFAEHGDLSLAPRFGGGRAHDIDVLLPGLDLPYRALMLVLLAFAIVVGPVNLYWVKRTKKPVLLLVSVPVIAIVFSLAMFAYGVVAQGLDVRARRSTLTLLDQRAHRATTLETREIFAGLAPGRGLRPGPGAWLFADPEAVSFSQQRRASIESTEGLEYGGDYLPARTPTRQTIVTDRAARGRVELMRENGGWSARFGLGADVKEFVYRDASGATWLLAAPVNDGGSAGLVPGEGGVDTGETRRIVAGDLADELAGLPLGAYWAALASTPFSDDLGLEVRDVESEHSVVGIVDLAEAR